MRRWLGPALIGAFVVLLGWRIAQHLPFDVEAAPTAAPEVVSDQAAASKPPFDSAKAWEHLRQLVAIGPRPSGSPAIRQTRAYITRQITAMGLTVQEQPFVAQTPIGPIDMMNLIVRLPGRRTDRILFTGHYDTKRYPPTKPFVGASDGGSSAAFLIELARVLKDRPREFTTELVWLDGEEAVREEWRDPDHTYGSRYYVEAAKRANAVPTIKAMILVDMIGDRDLQIRRENKSTPWLTDIIWAAAKRIGQGGVFIDAATDIEDDHIHFLAAGIPSVDIIDLDYPQWHNTTCCDDLNHVGARSLQIVGDVLLAALPDIERRLTR